MHVALAVFVGLASIILAASPKLDDYGLYLGIFGAVLASYLCKMAVDEWNSNNENNKEERRKYEDLVNQHVMENNISIKKLEEAIQVYSNQLNLCFDSLYKAVQGINLAVSEFKECQQSVSAEHNKITCELFYELKQFNAKNKEVVMSSLNNIEEDMECICDKINNLNDLREFMDENFSNTIDSIENISNKYKELIESYRSIQESLKDYSEKSEERTDRINNNFETFMIRLNKQHEENQNLCKTISNQYTNLSKEDNDILKRIKDEVFRK